MREKFGRYAPQPSNHRILWGHTNSTVYTTRPANIDKLKLCIQNAFGKITVEMREKTMLGFRARLKKLIENDGGHIKVQN